MMEQSKTTRKPPEEKLNKSENEVLEILKSEYEDALILSHCLKLPFSDGTTYTPDLFLWSVGSLKPVIIEVKGGYKGPGWEQGMERYRRAKEKWGKWFVFQLWEKKNGKWEIS